MRSEFWPGSHFDTAPATTNKPRDPDGQTQVSPPTRCGHFHAPLYTSLVDLDIIQTGRVKVTLRPVADAGPDRRRRPAAGSLPTDPARGTDSRGP
jgi:hypothetical protein